jgi:hypothetical protein
VGDSQVPSVPTQLQKKCHETETERVWPPVRQPRTRRSQKINMSRDMRPYNPGMKSCSVSFPSALRPHWGPSIS